MYIVTLCKSFDFCIVRWELAYNFAKIILGLFLYVGKYKVYSFVFKGPECRRQNLDLFMPLVLIVLVWRNYFSLFYGLLYML